MPQTRSSRFTRHNILLHRGDYDAIRSHYGDKTAALVRQIVRKLANKARAEAERPSVLDETFDD